MQQVCTRLWVRQAMLQDMRDQIFLNKAKGIHRPKSLKPIVKQAINIAYASYYSKISI